MTIKDMKVGETAIIIKLSGKESLRARLLDMGFTPKTLIKVQKIAPLGDPIQIQIRDYEITLRKNDAKNVYVKKEVPVKWYLP